MTGVRPVPECVTFDGGLMRFEQLVTVTAEHDVQIPMRASFIQIGKRVAGGYGYQFCGEGKVDRIATTSPGIMLYRLTVPVCPEGEDLR